MQTMRMACAALALMSLLVTPSLASEQPDTALDDFYGAIEQYRDVREDIEHDTPPPRLSDD